MDPSHNVERQNELSEEHVQYNTIYTNKYTFKYMYRQYPICSMHICKCMQTYSWERGRKIGWTWKPWEKARKMICLSYVYLHRECLYYVKLWVSKGQCQNMRRSQQRHHPKVRSSNLGHLKERKLNIKQPGRKKKKSSVNNEMKCRNTKEKSTTPKACTLKRWKR